MLDCYQEPATPDEIASDLQEVAGLDRETARTSSANAAHWFRSAGLIVSEDQQPKESWRFHYPPAAST